MHFLMYIKTYVKRNGYYLRAFNGFQFNPTNSLSLILIKVYFLMTSQKLSPKNVVISAGQHMIIDY